MGTHSDPNASSSATELRRLLETDRRELVDFLQRSPEENVYPLSRIAVDGVVNEESTAHGRFYGHFGPDGLDGVIFFGHRKGVVLVGGGDDFARAAANLALGPESDWVILVGRRREADEFLSHYRWRGRATHLNRVQDYDVLRQPSDLGSEGVRRAELTDLAKVAEMSEQMLLEDFDLPVGSLSREGILESMRHKILDGRTWVLEERGEIVFKVDVSAHFSGGSQIEGVFTRPDLRGRGYGSRGVASVASELLRVAPFVSLHVDRDNLPARRAYEKAGFRIHSEYRLVLLQVTRD